MKLAIAFAAVALAASPALADFSGDYTVTLFAGHHHKGEGRPLCVTFTQNHAVRGFPESGTFTSSSLPDWHGFFVVDKAQVRFYGMFDGDQNILDIMVKPSHGDGSYDAFQISPFQPSTDGHVTFTAGCAA